MIDSAPSVTLQPPLASTVEFDSRRLQTKRRELIRSMMPVVLVGVALALVALLGLRWPTSPAFDADYGPQFQRIVRGLAGESPRGIAGVLVDSSVYVLIVVAIVLAGLTMVRGQREFLGTLVVTGLLGVAYCAGMVLYVGPMVATSAFMLISLASLMTWLATGTDESVDEGVDEGADADVEADADKIAMLQLGKRTTAAASTLAVADSDVPALLITDPVADSAQDNQEYDAIQPASVDDSSAPSVDQMDATPASAMPPDLPEQGYTQG